MKATNHEGKKKKSTDFFGYLRVFVGFSFCWSVSRL